MELWLVNMLIIYIVSLELEGAKLPLFLNHSLAQSKSKGPIYTFIPRNIAPEFNAHRH